MMKIALIVHLVGPTRRTRWTGQTEGQTAFITTKDTTGREECTKLGFDS